MTDEFLITWCFEHGALADGWHEAIEGFDNVQTNDAPCCDFCKGDCDPGPVHIVRGEGIA